jgi:hypothetical protein
MEALHELKKWIVLGFEPQPIILSIIGKIDKLINKNMKNETEQSPKSGEWRNDPENYNMMAVPFTSEAELETATESFYQEVALLRKKFKMTDVIVVTKNSVITEKGSDSYMAIQQYGDGMTHPELMARAFLKIKKDIINKLNEAANIKE